MTSSGQLEYEVVEGWGKLPEGWRWGQVGGVAVDSHDEVHVFTRSDHPSWCSIRRATSCVPGARAFSMTRTASA